MSKRRQRIGDEEYVWGFQAAKILGVSWATFYVRFHENRYPNIDAINTLGGIKYLLRDVVVTAYPYISDEKIDEIIISFRKTGFYRRKQRKKGSK